MITISQLEQFADQLGVRIGEHTLTGSILGCYNADKRLIILEPNLSRIQYKCTLAHELVHASFNDESCMNTLDHVKQESRCRRITARLLINDTDYAIAEQMYDASIPLIARELDVTQQIVKDYQKQLNTVTAYAERSMTVSA